MSLQRRSKPRRVKKPTVTFSGRKPHALLKYYTEKNGDRGFKVFWCLGPGCQRTPKEKVLCKQRCIRCLEGKEGETLLDIAKRILIVGGAHIPKEEIDQYLLDKMSKEVPSGTDNIGTSGTPDQSNPDIDRGSQPNPA